jgi:hypothetical protein
MRQKMSKTDTKFRTALDFLLSQEGRKAQSRLSKEQNIDSGYLNSIIKGRKPGSITVREKIASHFELEYEDMLYLGRWILSGNDGIAWTPFNNGGDVGHLPTKPDTFRSKGKTCYEDKNLQLLSEWINLQNEPADFWILIKMDLSRKYPGFDAWLKKRRGEDHQRRLPEKKSAA